jgi:hypothetical protein
MEAIGKNDVARMSGDLAVRLDKFLHAAPLGMYWPMTHL